MDYKSDLKKLRESYIKATPMQRLCIAWQRIVNPGHGPNLLVAYVSAVEGFARSLAMHQEAHTKEKLSLIYPKYRNKNIEELITQYLQSKIDLDPETFFGTETWRKLRFAISYRNLLAHECTYLGQNKYPDLLNACKEVLTKLEGLQYTT
jgi:hypothetical protein